LKQLDFDGPLVDFGDAVSTYNGAFDAVRALVGHDGRHMPDFDDPKVRGSVVEFLRRYGVRDFVIMYTDLNGRRHTVATHRVSDKASHDIKIVLDMRTAHWQLGVDSDADVLRNNIETLRAFLG
jgi:hypothetical protein